MPIHPAVLIEAPVLGGDECLAHVNWDLRDGYIQSTDNREPTHEPAGAIEDSTAFVGMIGLNLAWTGAALESARAEPDIQCEDADDRRHQRHLKDQLTPIPDSSFPAFNPRPVNLPHASSIRVCPHQRRAALLRVLLRLHQQKPWNIHGGLHV